MPPRPQELLKTTSVELGILARNLHRVCPSLDCLHIHTPGSAKCRVTVTTFRFRDTSDLGCLHYLRAFHATDWLAMQPMVLRACSGGLEELGVHFSGSGWDTPESVTEYLSKALDLLPKLQLLRLHRAGHVRSELRFGGNEVFAVMEYTMDLVGPLLRVLPQQLATLELVDSDIEVRSPLQGSKLGVLKHINLLLQPQEGQLRIGAIAGEDGGPGRAATAEEVAAVLCTVLGRPEAAPAESEEAIDSGGAGGSSNGSSSFALCGVQLRGMSFRLASGEESSDGQGETASVGALGWVRDFALRTPVRLAKLLLQLPRAVDEEGLHGALQELQALLLVLAGPVGCAVVSCTEAANVGHVVSVVSALLDVGLEAEGRRPVKVEVRGCRREAWEEAVEKAAAGVGTDAAGVRALVAWGGAEGQDTS